VKSARKTWRRLVKAALITITVVVIVAAGVEEVDSAEAVATSLLVVLVAVDAEEALEAVAAVLNRALKLPKLGLFMLK